MSATTGISWCDRTWSPWIGCTKISPACDGCYAAHLMDTRLGRVAWGPHGERKRTSDAYWRTLKKWDREAKAAGTTISVFPSLCDPWDNAADPGIRREWFAVMRETPHLLHLLLSKRPQNAVAMVEAAGGLPSNAALGATCEDQRRADINLPHLLLAKQRLDARLAFLSCEPLLGPIDFVLATNALRPDWRVEPGTYDTLGGSWWAAVGDPDFESRSAERDLPRLDWVITGGETDQGAHRARPSHPDWFRSIRDQCAAAGVPYHHKQNGEWLPTGDWYENHPVSLPIRAWTGSEWTDDSRLDAEWVARVGKKVAGRLLDGIEHNGMPPLPATTTLGSFLGERGR